MNRVSIAPGGTEFAIPSNEEINTSFDQLVSHVKEQRQQGRQIVVVQGLGCVGTAVAAVIADARGPLGQPLYFVIGVDLPTPASYWKVAKLNNGVSPVISTDNELPRLIHKAVRETKNLCATVSEQAYSLADVILVDIPLDVTHPDTQSLDDIEIDLKRFERAIQTVGRHMRPDALILIETTVPIGTCEAIVLPILRKERSQRDLNEPLYLAHAYERVMPGPHYVDSIRRYWRTFAGIDGPSAAKAREFLESFIDTKAYPLWELDNTRSSELAKLLENSYRATNIAFIYEWTLLAEQLGINLFAVIESIRVREGTHDNMRLPGFGVGGYCLTKDSLLAQWSASHLFENGVILQMTLDALQINREMPKHTFDLLSELAQGDLANKAIAICGVSYLSEVADTRNSPTELLVDELLKAEAQITVHDPLVRKWPERSKIPLTQDLAECLEQAEGIVFAVPHRMYLDLPVEALLNREKPPPIIVDAQNIISDEKAKLLYDAGCRLLGVGKGHWRKQGYHRLK